MSWPEATLKIVTAILMCATCCFIVWHLWRNK